MYRLLKSAVTFGVVVFVLGGWSLFGSDEPAGPPNEEDVRIALGADYIQHVRCQTADDDKGGYICSYRKDNARTLIGNPGDYYMSRLTWENGGWQASRP